MTFAERIKIVRKQCGLTQQDMANIAGVSREAVSLWETKGTVPGRKRLQKIVEETGVDYLWLTTGEGSSQKGGLPVLGTVAGGVWIEAAAVARRRTIPIAPDPNYPAESQFALIISGQSVNKVAQDGEYIHCVDIVKAGLSPRSGDLVVVERKRGGMHETTVKRLTRVNGHWELRPESDSDEFQDSIPYSDDASAEVELRAVVIGSYTLISRGT